jgi:hypothetical protein
MAVMTIDVVLVCAAELNGKDEISRIDCWNESTPLSVPTKLFHLFATIMLKLLN